jgi:hypothetical protein
MYTSTTTTNTNTTSPPPPSISSDKPHNKFVKPPLTHLQGASTQYVETPCKRVGKVIHNFFFTHPMYMSTTTTTTNTTGGPRRAVARARPGGGGDVVLVVVVVVDVYMGWVKKKLCITLPTILHGVYK